MIDAAAPLELKGVTSGYGDVAIIRSVRMTFPKGVITTIVGSNGAGKSTAIKVAAGLLRAWKGSILVHGIDITPEAAHRRVHRGIAYVPQGRIVVPEMSVRDNLMLGAHILGSDRVAIDAATNRVMQLFPALGPRLKQQADTMSGGEQQMLAIGRALMGNPRVLLLDEPSEGLAPLIVAEVGRAIGRLKEEGQSIILVEQNLKLALEVADQAVILNTGRCVFAGTTGDVLNNEDLIAQHLGVFHAH
jgi:branched-chain amino acid transport system ATP-binding protein